MKASKAAMPTQGCFSADDFVMSLGVEKFSVERRIVLKNYFETIFVLGRFSSSLGGGLLILLSWKSAQK